jgi:hypothetical protein
MGGRGQQLQFTLKLARFSSSFSAPLFVATILIGSGAAATAA